MSDFILNAFCTALLYSISLAAIFSLKKAPKDVRILLICVIIIIFSTLNAFVMSVKENTLNLEIVGKEWDRYVEECRQEHISWSELTFPEWLSVKASE